MKKNEVRAYNELNRAIGRLGELKNAIIESDGDMGIKYRDIIEAIKITLEHSVEEYNTKARPKAEVRLDIISILGNDAYETYNLIIDWDSEYEIHEDADDVFSYPSDMFADCDLDDIGRLMDNEKFFYKNGYVVFADEEDITSIILNDDEDDLDDFIEYLVDSRGSDEGDLNELLAEYENAEEQNNENRNI